MKTAAAAPSLSRPGLSLLSVFCSAVCWMSLSASAIAGVESTDGSVGRLPEHARPQVANAGTGSASVMDKSVARPAHDELTDAGGVLSVYLDLHERALGAARTVLMPLRMPVPQ